MLLSVATSYNELFSILELFYLLSVHYFAHDFDLQFSLFTILIITNFYSKDLKKIKKYS